MQEQYFKTYSHNLNRDMEHALIGHAGKLCLAFAPQNGHTWDFRNFGMVETVRPWIEAGKLRMLLVDSIDEESWSNEGGDGRYRAEQQERWFHYVAEELVPQHIEWGEKAMATGCSMGGVHAANAFFRRPDPQRSVRRQPLLRRVHGRSGLCQLPHPLLAQHAG